MRNLVSIVAAVIAVFVSPAWAERAATSADFAPSHIAAAHNALQAMWVDSGVLTDGGLMVFTLAVPTLQQQLASAPWHESLPAETQRALNAYIASTPPIRVEESIRAWPQLRDAYAPRLAAILSEAELGDLTTYVRSPGGRSFTLRSFTEGARRRLSGERQASPPTETELEAGVLFAQTPGGIAFSARAGELRPLLSELGAAVASAPRITARLQHDMCAIAGDGCPQEWRER